MEDNTNKQTKNNDADIMIDIPKSIVMSVRLIISSIAALRSFLSNTLKEKFVGTPIEKKMIDDIKFYSIAFQIQKVANKNKQ